MTEFRIGVSGMGSRVKTKDTSGSTCTVQSVGIGFWGVLDLGHQVRTRRNELLCREDALIIFWEFPKIRV